SSFENGFRVGNRDRPVSDAPLAGDHLDHRLEPMQAARAIAHDLNRCLPGCFFDRGGGLVRADWNSGRSTPDLNAKPHRSAPPIGAPSFFSSSRAITFPSSIADGDTEQSPRQ